MLGMHVTECVEFRLSSPVSPLSVARGILRSGCEGGRSDREAWLYECKLCRARFTKRSYCWPCDANTPPHDTFHEVTARRIYCIGSRCIGRVLGPALISR